MWVFENKQTYNKACCHAAVGSEARLHALFLRWTIEFWWRRCRAACYLLLRWNGDIIALEQVQRRIMGI